MDILFLVLSLFLPRITLIIYWFINQIPLNTVPLIGDLLLGVFFPRILILIYIVQNMGTDNVWFWIHLVVAILVYSGSIREGKKRRKRKKEQD